MKQNILFLTNLHNSDPEEDRYLIKILKKEFEIIVTHPLECEKYLATINGIIIRNIWPTYEYVEEWERIVKVIQDLKIPTYNPLTGKGDNRGKDYLVELYRQGFPVIPSIDRIEDIDKLPASEFYYIKPKDSCDGFGDEKLTKSELLKKDLIFITLFPLVIFVSVFCFGLQITYLQSLILVLAVPSIYLSFRAKEKVKKVAWFSLLVSIPIAVIFELVAFGDHAWTVPQSILPYRLFGFIPVEDFLWQFLTVYLILMFYEYFRNKRFRSDVSTRIRAMFYILYGLALTVGLVFLTSNSFLQIPYAFLWLGLVFFLVPIHLFLRKYRSYFIPFLKVQIFFCYIHLMFELIGLKSGHWIFGGAHYVGWLNILGFGIPAEEFVFVMLLGAFATCTYYEFFTNKDLN